MIIKQDKDAIEKSVDELLILRKESKEGNRTDSEAAAKRMAKRREIRRELAGLGFGPKAIGVFMHIGQEES
jgi:hypothetical protein